MAKKAKLPEPEKYELDFTDEQWEEIDDLRSLTGLPPERELYRSHWVAVGMMCVGKAKMLDDNYYGPECEDEGFDPDEWASELTEIADTIFDEFRPGDGKI